MNVQRLFPLSLSLITAAVLSACATQNTPTASKTETVVQPKSTSIPSRRADSESKVLSDYSQYQSAIDAAKRGDDAWVQQFLSQASDSAMAENLGRARPMGFVPSRIQQIERRRRRTRSAMLCRFEQRQLQQSRRAGSRYRQTACWLYPLG